MAEEEIVLTKDYKMLRQIGGGTFGKVFLGQHIPSSLPIAIKVLEKTKIVTDADYSRICRELRIITSTHHPHIIELLDIIEGEKYIFLMMELMKGGELYEEIVKNRRLREEQAFSYFHQLLSALEYLHGCNMTHRDLKPENILLSEDKKTLKIIDFGLGRDFSTEELLKTPCGSPNYAPPEMLEGKYYDPRKADMWSLGVVLYAMLVGTLPFEDAQTDILYKKIIDCKYDIPQWLSDEAKDILNKMVTPAENRTSFNEIKQTPWYVNNLKLLDTNDLCDKSKFNDIDNDIIERILPKKEDLKKTVEIILKRKHSPIYAHYRLLKIEKDDKTRTEFKEKDNIIIESIPTAKIDSDLKNRTTISENQVSSPLVPQNYIPREEQNFSIYEGIIQVENLMALGANELFESIVKHTEFNRQFVSYPQRGGFSYNYNNCSFFISIEKLKDSPECCYIVLRDSQPSLEEASNLFRKNIASQLIF